MKPYLRQAIGDSSLSTTHPPKSGDVGPEVRTEHEQLSPAETETGQVSKATDGDEGKAGGEGRRVCWGVAIVSTSTFSTDPLQTMERDSKLILCRDVSVLPFPFEGLLVVSKPPELSFAMRFVKMTRRGSPTNCCSSWLL